jgi:GTP-binding protein HflX
VGQASSDHRRIRRKISVLSAAWGVAAHRANRAEPPPVAAAGGDTAPASQALLRALSDEVFVEDRLFATLDTLTREVDVGEGYRFRVTDTVGFIRKLPHHLVASFRATLEEARAADVLLHVIDASHGSWEEQANVVESVLQEMGLYGVRGAGAERTDVVAQRQRTWCVLQQGGPLPIRSVRAGAERLPTPC